MAHEFLFQNTGSLRLCPHHTQEIDQYLLVPDGNGEINETPVLTDGFTQNESAAEGLRFSNHEEGTAAERATAEQAPSQLNGDLESNVSHATHIPSPFCACCVDELSVINVPGVGYRSLRDLYNEYYDGGIGLANDFWDRASTLSHNFASNLDQQLLSRDDTPLEQSGSSIFHSEEHQEINGTHQPKIETEPREAEATITTSASHDAESLVSQKQGLREPTDQVGNSDTHRAHESDKTPSRTASKALADRVKSGPTRRPQRPILPAFAASSHQVASSVPQLATVENRIDPNRGEQANRPQSMPELNTLIAQQQAAQDEPVSLYTATFQDFVAAHQYLTPSNRDFIVRKLDVPNDDWLMVKTIDLHHHCRRIFEALSALPGEPAVELAENVKQYSTVHQANMLASIKKVIKADPIKVEARVMVLIQEIVKLHEEGAPVRLSMSRATRAGYRLETNLLCSERVSKVVAGAQNNKYFAHDIASGVAVEDMARAPWVYQRRKMENERVNAKKAKERDEKRELNQQPSSNTSAPQAVAGAIADSDVPSLPITADDHIESSDSDLAPSSREAPALPRRKLKAKSSPATIKMELPERSTELSEISTKQDENADADHKAKRTRHSYSA